MITIVIIMNAQEERGSTSGVVRLIPKRILKADAGRTESGKGTPMTYRLRSGEQLVAIAVGGGGSFGEGDYVVAFRLPR